MGGVIYNLGSTNEELSQTQIVEQQWGNNSFQFWNTAPMSVGNTTTFEFNETGTLKIEIEIGAFFHTPSEYPQGYINYTLFNGNDSVFSGEFRHGYESFTVLINDVSNITMQIHASCTDNATDKVPGDYYIVETYCEMWAK